MNLNIAEHFNAMKKRHSDWAAETAAKKGKIALEIARITKEKESRSADKIKKQKLLRQNEEEGLEVSQLKKKINELDALVTQSEAELSRLQKADADCTVAVQRSFEREDLLVSILKNVYKLEEAEVISGLEERFKTLTVSISKTDAAGHPKECILQIGLELMELKIRSAGNRWCTDFHPPALRWLGLRQNDHAHETWHVQDGDPDTATRNVGRNPEELKVWYDGKTEKIILSQELKWQTTWKQQTDQWKPPTEQTARFEDKFTDITISLVEKVDEAINAANGDLDLTSTYPDNPLLAYVREQILAQTTDISVFHTCKEQLTPKEIYERIKVEWEGFTHCPWSAQLTGVLALAKYHVENGERARFWSKNLEGHYGLRIRTRDHDWIVGEIYIDPNWKADADKPILLIHSRAEERGHGRHFESDGTWVASWREMFLTVGKEN
jgi:hypothetical protein